MYFFVFIFSFVLKKSGFKSSESKKLYVQIYQERLRKECMGIDSYQWEFVEEKVEGVKFVIPRTMLDMRMQKAYSFIKHKLLYVAM